MSGCTAWTDNDVNDPKATLERYVGIELRNCSLLYPRQFIRRIHHFIRLLNLSSQNHTGLGGTNVHKDDARAGGGIRSCVEQRRR